MQTLAEYGKEYAQQMLKNTRGETIITKDNVYQEANRKNLLVMQDMTRDLVLPESGILHAEYLDDLLNQVKNGKRALILSEHYSNMDLPVIYYLLKKSGAAGAEIADRLVAIAGMKLNEDNPVVCAFAESFSRIVIYPSRSLQSITDPEEHAREEHRSKEINMASMRALDRIRRDGKIVLVFPSGTRYRPGHPETKRGLREIDSYLRISDIMVMISINGNVLRIGENSDMMSDLVCRDKMTLSISPVYSCKDFREEQLNAHPGAPDSKQVTVDKIMEILDVMHAAAGS